MKRAAFTGTGRLVRLALRRDRVVLPVWLLSLTGLAWASATSMAGLYSSEAERIAVATLSAAMPLARVFDGPASGPTIGALTMVEIYGSMSILVGLMAITTVTRHTRQEEETGRAELLGAAAIGRLAPLTAALCVSAGACVVAGGAIGGVLAAGRLPLDGSVLAGVAFCGVGVVFAGVGAIAAQVASSQRGANGLGGVAMATAFCLRAVGDVLGDVASSGVEVVSAWPSWLSPIGWGQQVRAFSDDRWEVLGLFAVAGGALVGTAFLLTRLRDVGAGLLPDQPGPARAGAHLRTPVGLAWRLQRRLLTAWLVAVAVMAGAFGAMGESAEELLDVSDDLAAFFEAFAAGGNLLDAFAAVMMAMLAMAASGYTVQALLRLRTEEATGRAEPVLATAVSRRSWLLATVLVAAAGTAVVIGAAGVAGAVGFGVVTGAWGDGFARFLPAALVHVPAALALGALVVAAVAIVPRWATAISWTALAASFVAAQLGELLELPQPVLDLSPFTHVPAVPLDPVVAMPLVALMAVALGVAGVGLAVFRRRDVIA